MATVQVSDRWHRRSAPTEGAQPCKCGTKAHPYASGEHGTGKRWLVRYRVGGQQKKIAFDRKPDAQREAARVKSSMDAGSYLDPTTGRTTFGEVAAKWQEATGHGRRPSTVASVERALRLHILPTLGDRPVDSITRSDVQAWVTDRAAHLQASSLEVTYGTLRAIFAWAVGEFIQASPCDSKTRAGRVRLPSKAPKEVVPLSAAQVGALVDAAPPLYRAAIILAAASGLRQGELFGLEVSAIGDGEITVRRQLVVVDGKGVHLGPVKTSSSRRVVPVPRAVTEALRVHLDAFPAVPRALPDTVSGTARERRVKLIFATVAGEPVQRSPWARTWAKIVKGANGILGEDDQIPAGTSLHDLRHTYASLLIRHGESVKVVQKRLGHSSAAITLDTYSHLWPDSAETTRAAVELGLGNILGGGTQGTTQGTP